MIQNKHKSVNFFCWFKHFTIWINKNFVTILLTYAKSTITCKNSQYSIQFNKNLSIFCWFGHHFIVVYASSNVKECKSSNSICIQYPRFNCVTFKYVWQLGIPTWENLGLLYLCEPPIIWFGDFRDKMHC